MRCGESTPGLYVIRDLIAVHLGVFDNSLSYGHAESGDFIEKIESIDPGTAPVAWKKTEKGEVFIDMLLRLPAPINKWVDPTN